MITLEELTKVVKEKGLNEAQNQVQARAEEIKGQAETLQKEIDERSEQLVDLQKEQKNLNQVLGQAIKNATKGVSVTVGRKRGRKPGQEVNRRTNDQIEKDREQIVQVLHKADEPMAISDLASALNRDKSIALKHDIDKLMESGKVAREGNRATSTYKVA